MVPADETTGWPFVKSTVVYEVVDSTSDRAGDHVREGRLPLPLAVWAKSQSHGRGQGSNSWWSDTGSLTVTLALNPRDHGLVLENEPQLALATAVAIIEALNELGLGHHAIGIRWPNDLEADGRKLAGILPEQVETAHGRRLLIGIGLNVRTNLAAAPPEIRTMATSLAELHQRPIDDGFSNRLVPAILGRFEAVLARLAAGDQALADQWNQLDLLRDTWVRVDLGTCELVGLGQGIDNQGALCLNQRSKQIRIFGGRLVRPLNGAV
jgi:BirA family biotin operon repressor/biotin-[acetyl-CoA-carboxylase] ligase